MPVACTVSYRKNILNFVRPIILVFSIVYLMIIRSYYCTIIIAATMGTVSTPASKNQWNDHDFTCYCRMYLNAIPIFLSRNEERKNEEGREEGSMEKRRVRKEKKERGGMQEGKKERKREEGRKGGRNE